MFGARGISLGLGGVNLNDLSNLRSSNAAAHRVQQRLQVQQQKNRYSSSSNSRTVGVGGASSSSACVSGSAPPTTTQTSTSTTTTTNAPPTTAFKNPVKSSLMEPKKKTRIVVKKTLDRTTFWSVCRALVFGCLLIALGVAMSTIGYYKEYFATEIITSGNETITLINYTTRTQFESLSYIGPCVMGCGMFVLMLACVMTLEGRDLNTQVYSQRLSRKASSRRSTRSRTENDDEGKLTEQTGPTDEQKSLHDDSNKHQHHQTGSNNNIDNNNKYDDGVDGGDGGGDFKGDTSAGGNINQCFTKDDSKVLKQSQQETDSAPYSTTTTLTWSRSGGARCEPLPPHEAVVTGDHGGKRLSASSVDALTKTANARALLQRFLEDQSRLVDDRMRQMRLRKLLGKESKKRRGGSGGEQLKKQSASLDVAGSEKLVDVQRCVRSDDYSNRLKHNVVAEVHHSGDAQSPLAHPRQSVDSTDSTFDPRIHGYRSYYAPIASAEQSDIFCSPMSFSPDLPFVTPAGRGHNNVASSNGRPTPSSYLSAAFYSPSPVRSRQNSLSVGSQLSVNSYKTVKSHISAASVNGLSNNDVYKTTLNEQPPSCSLASFDFINGNKNVDVQSEIYAYHQPYYNQPSTTATGHLLRMNNYQLNDDNLTEAAFDSSARTGPEGRLYSVSCDPNVNVKNQQSKKHISSKSKSNVRDSKTRSNV